MLWRSAVNALSSTSKRASETHAGGHDPHAAGINRRWSGSIHLHRNSNPNQLHLQWLLEQQQGRHLSCQSPYWMEDQAQAPAWHAGARNSNPFCRESFMLRMPASAVSSVVASLVADLKINFLLSLPRS
jgi:hypothetical protein